MNIIEKLNSISVDDLKNIDWVSLKNRLFSKPGLLINILLIAVTIITIVVTFQFQAKTRKTLKIETKNLKEKVEAVHKLELTQKQYKEFLKNVPKTISENRLIEMLSEIALKRGVRIASFSPANKVSGNFINLTNVEVVITSKNYSDIVRFINDIENSPHSLRIAEWSGVTTSLNQSSRRYSRRSASQNSPRNEQIEAKVKIETVEFKYE